MPPVSLQYELDLDPASSWITITPNPVSRRHYLYLQEVGEFIAGPKYYTRRAGLDSFLLKYVVAGEGLLDYGGRTYPLRPGDCMLLDCRQPQYYRTAPGKPLWHILWIHFYGSNSRAYYDEFLRAGAGLNAFTLLPRNEMAATLRALLRLYSDGQTTILRDIRASALITQAFADCIESQAGAGTVTLPQNIREARNYLIDHSDQRITLDDLARRYHLNKYYFHKLFRRHVGLTPNDFLILSRITRAKELLRTTSQSVGDIALSVGMGNTSHFINLFKKHEGLTPSVYRGNWSGR